MSSAVSVPARAHTSTRARTYAILIALFALIFSTVPAVSASAAPTVTPTPTTLSQTAMGQTGVTFAVRGFPASASVTLAVDGVNRVSGTANADGAINMIYRHTSMAAGTHTAVVSGAGATANTTFTVTADPVVIDPVVTVTPETLTQAQAGDTGISIKGTGYPQSTSVSILIDGTLRATTTTSSTGTVNVTLTAPGIAAGTHTLALTAGQVTASDTFTVTPSTTPTNPKLTATPATLSQTQMASSGVTFGVTGFAPNTVVTLSIDGVNRTTATTTASGNVNIVYRSSALTSGAHTAKVTAGADTATASFTVTADPLNPKISVTPTSLSQDAMSATGITVAITGFPANANVTVAIDGVNRATALTNNTGAVNVVIRGALAAGAHTVTATSGASTASASFTVTASPTTSTPQVDVTPASLSQSAMTNTGITVAITGFPANAAVTLAIDGVNRTSAQTNANGAVNIVYRSSALAAGSHTVTVTSGTATASDTFTVTADPVVINPKVTANPTTISEFDLESTGITFSATGYPASTLVSLAVDGTTRVSGTTNTAGAITFTLRSGTIAPGSHTAVVAGGGATASATFTVTADPVVIDPVVTVSPKTLTQEQAGTTGITVTGTGYPRNASVTLALDGAARGTATSDSNGKVVFTLTATGIPGGTHTVTLTAGTARASDTFTVTVPATTAKVTADPGSRTQTDMANLGIRFVASGFPASTAVSFQIDGTTRVTGTTSSTGVIAFTYRSSALAVGTHTAKITGGGVSASTTFAITAG